MFPEGLGGGWEGGRRAGAGRGARLGGAVARGAPSPPRPLACRSPLAAASGSSCSSRATAACHQRRRSSSLSSLTGRGSGTRCAGGGGQCWGLDAERGVVWASRTPQRAPPPLCLTTAAAVDPVSSRPPPPPTHTHTQAPDDANYAVAAPGRYWLRDGGLHAATSPSVLVVSDLDDTMIGDDKATDAFRLWWQQAAVPAGGRLVSAQRRVPGRGAGGHTQRLRPSTPPLSASLPPARSIAPRRHTTLGGHWTCSRSCLPRRGTASLSPTCSSARWARASTPSAPRGLWGLARRPLLQGAAAAAAFSAPAAAPAVTFAKLTPA